MEISSNRRDSVKQQRKIKPTRRSVSGIFAFRGLQSVPYESTLERDYVAKAAFTLDVLDIVAQPVQIPFLDSLGRWNTYTPDYLTYYLLNDRHYENYPVADLVEVKYREDWKTYWREWSGKWKAARRYAIEQGWRFRVLDETRIRDQAFANIQFLQRYEQMVFVPEETRSILNNLQSMGAAPCHYLLARHFMGEYRARGVAHLWHLLATRQVDCDMSLPLNDKTELWVPDNAFRSF